VNVEGEWAEGEAPRGPFELQPFNVAASPGFVPWLAEQSAALAITTGDRLMLIGRRGERLDVREHRFSAAAGLAAPSPRTLLLASDWQLLRLEDSLLPGTRADDGHDRRYLAQSAVTTGFLGSYDIAVDTHGRPLFTSAVCNCVATVSPRLSFTAVWKPPFVSALSGGDRCRVTGLALEDGELAYVACAAATDDLGGWSAELADGGVLLDARSGETVAAGLSLPHSPRVTEHGLLVAAGGTGELLALDPATGSHEVVARVPGIARGLDVHGRFAVLGCSRLPDGSPYGDAPIAGSDEPLRQALFVIDLARGAVVAELELLAASGEVIAVAVLRDTVSPAVDASTGGLVERIAIA
jgi:uncharacterized protein (TIGR03032 family)